jgi:hypothetical protein
MSKPPISNEIELQSNAWDRFERAVDAVVKSGPQHKKKEKAGESKKKRNDKSKAT